MDIKIMNKLFCFLLIFGLSGCENRIDASCSSEGAQSLIKDIINEGVEKEIIDTKTKDGTPVFSIEKAKEVLNNIVISIEDVRTTKKDSESTKAFCSGNLVITVKKDILDQAEKGRVIAKTNTLSDYAKSHSIKTDASRFFKTVDYNVQPTDNGEKIYAALTEATLLSDMVGEIVTSYLLVPIIENNTKKQIEKSNTEQSKDKAMEATNEAGRQLQIVWDSATDNIKSSLLQEQLDWKKQSDDNCRVKATKENNDDVTKDIIYFNCLKEDNNKRTEYLKQKIASFDQ